MMNFFLFTLLWSKFNDRKKRKPSFSQRRVDWNSALLKSELLRSVVQVLQLEKNFNNANNILLLFEI